MNKVYIQVDSQNRITAINSDQFINNLRNWIYIDRGEGDKYLHAQNNYFRLPIITENGIYRYKYENNVIKERSVKEITQDFLDISKNFQQITDEERFDQIESAIIELAELIVEEKGEN